MKKVITLFAAMAMFTSLSFAQLSGNNAKSPVLKASNSTLVTPTKSGAKISGNPVWEDTMSYCLNAPFYTGVGMQNGGTFSWGIKIEPAALVGRNNLTDVQIFVYATGNYQLDIYNNGDTMPMGNALATQNMTAVAADTMTWKNIHLTNAVAINATQPLWVIFTTTAAETYPASATQPNQYDNGKFVGLNGTWMNVADAGVDATWMIRAISDTYIPQPPMIEISGSPVAVMGNAATFTAMTTVSSVIWYVDGSQNSETGLTLTYTFTTDGLHEVVAEASNAAGSNYDTLEVNVLDCSNIDLPYTAVFGDQLGCWDTICDSTHGSGWFTCTEMGLTEGQVLSISAESVWGIFMMDFPVDNWLISPEFTMPTSGDYEVAWSVKPYNPSYAGDHYGVYLLTANDTTLLFEESLNSNMTSFVSRMAIIPSTVSGDFRIAFRHYNCEGGYVIILDNIQIRPLSAPVLTLNGPTAVENGVAATFTAVCGNAESFTWNVDGSDLTDTTATITYIFTSDGIHTVSVTAENTVGDTTATMDVEVYSCDGIDEFPYSMGFEDGLRCWTMVSMDPANDNRFGIDTIAYTGNYGFKFSSYSSADDYNQYLITPEITLPTGEGKMFKFMYKAYNASESFQVLASTTDNNISSFTTVLGQVLETATTWTEVSFALPANTKYVAINYFGNYQYYLYIDDISIDNLTAPTVTLNGPNRIMVDNSATFTANAPLATSFSWTVDGTAVSGTTNTLTYTFTATGNYTVEVTAINSEGSSSANMTVEVFTCEHITNFPYVQDFETSGVFECWKFVDADGDGYNWNTDYLRNNTTPAGHNNSNGLVGSASWAQTPLTPDNWMIMPAIDVPAGSNLYLNWFAKGQDADYAAEHYSVYISTTGNNVNNFTNVVFSETTTGEWAGHYVELTSYANQTIYVAFRHHDVSDMFYLDIDDISISATHVSIDDVIAANISLYPNPTNDILNVEGEGINEIQLMDVNGRTVMTTAATRQLDLRGLAAGVYMVRVITNEGTTTQKIVKK